MKISVIGLGYVGFPLFLTLLKNKKLNLKVVGIEDNSVFGKRKIKEIFQTDKEYFISINIYNCTSPVFDFLTDGPATRCEINTYVVDKNNLKGTLIMDYISNIISLDPDNLFKKKGNIKFEKKNDIVMGYANNNNFNLEFNYNSKYNIDTHRLSSKLIRFTDVIFYNCGLYDKLYYDSSLIKNNIINCYDNYVKFNFLDLYFDEVHSVFYFQNDINFIGGMWANIFKD